MSTSELMVKVPFLDLKAHYQSVKAEIDLALEAVISEQKFILGPKVSECEEAVRAYSNVRFACGVSSGTDALLISLWAEGIGPGDEVICPAYSFFATAGAVASLGATPVFVDIDPITFNLNPAWIEEKISPKTKAIIPVHLFGQMADMDPILEIAGKHRLIVVEDAAQAIGAEYNGKRAGSMGDYGCLSFFPTKNLGCFGDGGMVLTNHEKRLRKIKALRVHGVDSEGRHALLGSNFRLDALQAAVITVKLNHLDAWTEKRAENAARYTSLFKESRLENFVTTPKTLHDRHIFNQFVIRAKKRNELMCFLKENQIGSAIYYETPLPLLECFANLGYKKGGFPESEKAAEESLALPIYPELTDDQLAQVVKTISAFYKS